MEYPEKSGCTEYGTFYPQKSSSVTKKGLIAAMVGCAVFVLLAAFKLWTEN